MVTASAQELYIPPRGIGFRLVGYASQYVLYSRTTQEPQVGHYPVDKPAQNQVFDLIPGTGKHAGLYLIKGRESGKVLYSRDKVAPYVWHVSGNGQYEDNWFKLEPGSGKYAGCFRLITPSQKVAIFSRATRAPYLSNHPAGTVYSDQYFSFLFEDMVIDRVDYDVDSGKILSSTPLVLASQTLVNDTNEDQTMSYSMNKTVTHTSTFTYALGFKIALQVKFKGGVPLVAEQEITVSAEQSNTFTWGETDTTSYNYTATFPVKAGPKTIVRAVSTVNQGVLEVPYTIHLSSVSTGAKTETKGVWQGVSTWDLRHTLSYLKVGEPEEEFGQDKAE